MNDGKVSAEFKEDESVETEEIFGDVDHEFFSVNEEVEEGDIDSDSIQLSLEAGCMRLKK